MTTTETRAATSALSSALSAPTPFRSRAGAMVDHAASRHVERWAPEEGAARSGSLRSVAFADRIITPWFEAPQRFATLRGHSEMAAHGPAARAVDGASWVFPRPWYQDEVAWLAAARVAANTPEGAARPVLTTRGTYASSAPASPASIFSAVPSSSDAFASAASAASVYGGPMELVAPSLTASSPVRVAASGGVVGRAAPLAMPSGLPSAALAAWSPIVPFQAAQAAQVVAGALDHAVRAGLGTSERSPILSSLSYVAPSELGAAPVRATAPMATGPSRPARPLGGLASSAVQAQLAGAVARIDAVMASGPAPSARSMEAPTLVTPPSPATASSATASSATAPPARRAAEPERTPAPTASTPTASTPTASTPTASTPAASTPAASTPTASMPTVVAPTAAASDPSIEAVRQLIASSPDAAAALRTVELITRGAASGAAMAPAAGPRIVLPAGLGGIASAVQTAAMVSRPLAVGSWSPATEGPTAFAPIAGIGPDAVALADGGVAPGLPLAARTAFAPIWAAPTTALSSIAAERPVGVGHVAWADRWLARMAGASPRSLSAFDPVAAEQAEPRLMASGAPEVVFVTPGLPPTAAARSAAEAAARRPVVPSSVRVDDSQAVSDDVFAAIARGRAAAASPRRAAAEVRPTLASPTAADVIATSAPAAPGAGFGASLAASPVAPALASIFPLPQVAAFDPRALFSGATARGYASGLFQPQVQRMADGFVPAAAPDLEAPASSLAAAAPAIEYVAPSGPERAEAGIAPPAAAESARFAPAAASAATIAGRAELIALTTSLLAAERAAPLPFEQAPLVAPTRAGWTPSPGTTAEMAHTMGVEQMRSSADLAFDFVGPELILAAQAYGFGPAEASQASRLALSGPGGLSAMATAVDLTFLRAMHEQRDAVGTTRAAATGQAAPTSSAASTASAASPTNTAPRFAAPAAAPSISEPITAYPTPPSPGERSALFGVERRLPRGAFLWPAGVVSALGIDAASADGTALPVAALELLAASAVADLGAWAVARGAAPSTPAPASDAVPGAPSRSTAIPMTAGMAASSELAAFAAEPAVQALPSAQRSRFETVYLALAQSSAGQSLSPSARAARALSVIARGDDGAGGGASSALERAAAAWSALPVVMAGELPVGASAAGAGTRAAPDTRGGGLAALSARAGELLGSLVSPSAAELFFGEEARTVGREAPAQTLVQPAPAPRAPTEAAQLGRSLGSFARHGGGDTEIPPWFEAAARRMLDSGGSGSEGISLAELTLIATAPASSVAAATRGSSPTPAAPAEGSSAGGAAQDNKLKPDIEQLAQDVYAEVVKMFDIMRTRNGEPSL